MQKLCFFHKDGVKATLNVTHLLTALAFFHTGCDPICILYTLLWCVQLMNRIAHLYKVVKAYKYQNRKRKYFVAVESPLLDILDYLHVCQNSKLKRVG